MCTKSIAFIKALAHTCLQISRVLCGEIKNFKPNKNKNVSNEKQALSQGLLFLLGAKFQDVWPGEGHSKCRVVGARFYEGHAGTCSATNGHLTEWILYRRAYHNRKTLLPYNVKNSDDVGEPM